jgi:hypothetical protein
MTSVSAEAPPPPLLLRQVDRPDERDLALDVLAAAGWSPAHLEEWAATGTVLELFDPAEDGPLGAAVVRPLNTGTYELLAWARHRHVATEAVSGRLVAAVADILRRNGVRRVVASVGDAEPERLTLLLDAGFRFASVERDAPMATRGGPLAGSRDLVWMDQDL